MNNNCDIQRSRPVHHAPVERFNARVIVQVNVCTKDRQPVLACDAGHRLCLEIWQASDFWRVGQYVIMPDHIHLFCAPGRVPVTSLRQWVEFWKSRIASRWPVQTDRTEPVPPDAGTGGTTSVSSVSGQDRTEPVPPDMDSGVVLRTGGTTSVSSVPRFKLWQRDFWDTQMRDPDHYNEKLSYVRMNPVRKGLVESAHDWPYQGVVHQIG